MSALQSWAMLLGRFLLAFIFILSGYSKIGNFTDTAAYMGSKGLPMPEVLLVPSIIIELGGGLMLALGIKARWAALALLLWLIPVTLVFHNFWAVPADQVQNQMNHFLKNIAIMGSMLYVMGAGPGPYSLWKDRADVRRPAW